MNKQRLSILIASSLGVLATFMPWVKAPLIGSINGTKGDGWLTFFLFAVPLALSLVKDRAKELKGLQLYGAVVPGFIAAMIGIWKVIDFNVAMYDFEDSPFAEIFAAGVSVEFGLYLVIFAGLALPVCGFLLTEKMNVEEINILTADKDDLRRPDCGL